MAFILLQSTQSAPSRPPLGLELSDINGQDFLTIVDSNRLKRLSVSENVLTFSEKVASDGKWFSVGNATDADSSYVAKFDGTIVFGSGQCEDTGSNQKDIHIYVNSVDRGTVGTLVGGNNAIFINNTINMDFSQGDTIRARALGSTGSIQDTVVAIVIKWRA